MSEIPPYRMREQIRQTAIQLTYFEEPAVKAEDCGATPEDMDAVLRELGEMVEDAREYTREEP